MTFVDSKLLKFFQVRVIGDFMVWQYEDELRPGSGLEIQQCVVIRPEARINIKYVERKFRLAIVRHHGAVGLPIAVRVSGLGTQDLAVQAIELRPRQQTPDVLVRDWLE